LTLPLPVRVSPKAPPTRFSIELSESVPSGAVEKPPIA